MHKRKWILGMVTTVGFCIMTASIWPEKADGSYEIQPMSEQIEVEYGDSEAGFLYSTEEDGQVVGSLRLDLENEVETYEPETSDRVSEVESMEESVPERYYLKTGVRLREKPTTQSEILCVIEGGEKVELWEKDEESGWCRVHYENQEGYLRYHHLSESYHNSCEESLVNDKVESTDSEELTPSEENSKEPGQLTETSKDQWEYLGNYYITGYRMFSASENGGRSDGVTASGVVGTPGHTAAMKGIPFGTTIYVDGLGFYVVEDRGVGEGCVDIACNTTNETYELTGYRDVYIVEYS